MMRRDSATVSASVPFRRVPSDAELIAALHDPEAHPELAPHLERLLLELPAQVALGFALRQGVPAAVLRAAHAQLATTTGLRNPALEAALDGMA
jgi:hypothetical protein